MIITTAEYLEKTETNKMDRNPQIASELVFPDRPAQMTDGSENMAVDLERVRMR